MDASDRTRRLPAGALLTLLVLALLGLHLRAPGPKAAVLQAVTTDTACPTPASRTGLCGTVGGYRGWYGSWTTAGDRGAYCLQHARQQPRPGLAYDVVPSTAGRVHVEGDAGPRLAYLLGRYGGTGDPARAAALAVLAHAAVGDTLTVADLERVASDLDPRVRAATLALWAEAGEQRGPYAVAVSLTGSTAALTVRSATGHGVGGAAVSWSGSTVVATGSDAATDAGGVARLHFRPGAPGALLSATATVGGLADDAFEVWIPRDQDVQTVAVGRPLSTVSASASVRVPTPAPPTAAPPIAAPPPPAPAPATLEVVKTTDDPGWVSPAGAVFHLAGPAGASGPLVVGPDGHTPPLGGLDATGPWTLVEETPCHDCDPIPPTPITLTAGGTTTVPVVDPATRHRLTVHKVAPDGSPLAGAVLHVRGARSDGAAYDDDRGTCTTAADGSCWQDLPSGSWQVTEETPAPGTIRADPATQTIPVQGGDAELTFTDRRLTTVAFHKAVAASAGPTPATVSLAGAVLVVSDGGGAEVGRCGSGDDGRCTLAAGVLTEGAAYFWSEPVAPSGLAPDATRHPFTATVPGATLEVQDQPLTARVSLHKSEQGQPDVPVPGAGVQLCAPAGGATGCSEGAAVLGAGGTTGADGTADLGEVRVGVRVCAVERVAPAGWTLATTPVCGDVPAEGLRLELAETRLPPSPPPSPTAAPSPPGPPPAAHPVAPRPVVRVLPVRTTRPAPSPRPAPTSAPPSVPAPALPPPLAYTGHDVRGALGLGGGLLGAGAAALLAGALARRRGRPGPALPLPTAPAWRGGWVPERPRDAP